MARATTIALKRCFPKEQPATPYGGRASELAKSTWNVDTNRPERKMAFNFPAQFLDEISNCWPEIVEWLNSHRDRLTNNMRTFVDTMAARKSQPSISQLGLLVSLVCNVELQIALEEHEKRKASRVNKDVQNDNIVDLHRYIRSRVEG